MSAQKNEMDSPASAHWTFFSNHGHVLLCLGENPDRVLREVAVRVGITERAVQRIVKDLEEAGAIRVEREGRRNRYRVNTRLKLRHEIEKHRTIGDLIGFIFGGEGKPEGPLARSRRRKDAEGGGVSGRPGMFKRPSSRE